MKRRLFTFALAALTIGLLGSCSKINERIDGLDQRVGNIENEKIASIEQQIAAINASIADLGAIRKDITDQKAASETLGKRIDTLKAYVGDLSRYAEKDWATALFATLEQLNATKADLLALQEKVDGPAISGAISNLETRISTLEARVSALEKMIQSVTIVPAYNDGSVESTKDGVLHLDIIVTPAEAVAAITKDCLKVMVNEVKTKAVDVDTVAVTKFKVDAAKGTITARADISSVLPEASGKALTIAVNVKNGISDYTTEFYPVTLSTESNVTVTDEGSTTKVTIKADEDFPESSAGNIVVADGFKDSKPTTVDIEVGGRGTVIFDAKATSQIKANAEQAGATSVFFKVEDVTTTKPVENADVVLEVTMKTVDENGTEVFNEDNAGEGAEVTIEIPIPEEKDVAFVNSVTLVNDAGEPIQGGVVPGSEDFDKEKGILSFKVNHFSKYAIDYVTKTDFVAVTGVSIEPAEVTLQVGDTLRLAAVIAPENATNKKVTWSSSDTTKVKVDNTGKITAVAFGQATITVTTKDGGKTATCAVKVSETKTMADILKTTTGIPESQNLTPPANAWVKSTDPDCKAFIGVDTEGDKLFVIKKEGSGLKPLGICMDDAFARIDDNTYQRIEPSVGTFTIKMAEGKFTSYEFTAASGSAYEQFNGTYSAPAASIAFDESPFEPGNIKAGQTLTIKGKNLNLVTKVVFCDNVEVTNFKSQSSEQIVIENFPVKARTGKVTLVSGTTSQEVTSDTDLVVAQPSVSEIYQFTEVTPKQKLTINGENFDLVYDAIIGDDVYLDYIVSNEGHTIEIEMPEEVHDGTVKVIAYSGVEVTVATVTAAPTISTIADVLATVDGGFPYSSSQTTIPDNAWVADVPNNRKCYAYTATSGSATALLLRIPKVGDVSGKYTALLTSLDVTKENNCYTVTYNNYGKLTFNMAENKLTSIKYEPINDGAKPFAGTYTAPTAN